ncbi:uncharacterized protein METZ01_LOCUS460255, partial [marine metagenome]
MVKQVQSICKHLLPNGKAYGPDWMASNVEDVSRKKPGTNTGSLRVNLQTGEWIDHGDTLQKGGILDLWMACRGKTFREALIEAADFVGHRPVGDKAFFNRGRKKPAPRESFDELLKPLEEGSPGWKWLTEVRGVSPEAI